MLPVQQFIDRIGPTEGRVLITGETGTGKEVVARAIYTKSKRADMPFVPVNCGALTQNLAESQLFGHKKGAFTGADRDHKGFFEVANGGTVFLDELGELDKNIQVKLLRFLESGEIQRLGRQPPDHGRRAGHLRDEPRPAADDRRGAVPRGPALPAEHVPRPPAAAARPPRRTSRTWPGTCSPARPSGRWRWSPTCSRPRRCR